MVTCNETLGQFFSLTIPYRSCDARGVSASGYMRGMSTYLYIYHVHLFCTSVTISLLTARIASRSRLRGTRGGRVYTRRKFRPRAGSVARALSVQSCASWQVITGSYSTSPSLVGQWKPHSLKIVAPLLPAAAVSCLYHTASLKHSNPLLRGTNGTTEIAHQALPVFLL